MRPLELVALYLAFGIVLTLSQHRREAPALTLADRLIGCLLWPVGLPLLFGRSRAVPARGAASMRAHASLVAAVREARSRGVDARLLTLLPDDALLHRMALRVEHLEGTLAELDKVLGARDFDRARAAEALSRAEREGRDTAGPREALDTIARLERRRLQTLHARDGLVALAGRLRMLATALRFAEHDAHPGADEGALRAELEARLEGVGGALSVADTLSPPEDACATARGR